MTFSAMCSSRSGRPVANQFLIYDGKGNVYFQSYDTIIAKRDKHGKVTLSSSWNYSQTTGKYLNQFLNERKPDTERKIKNGTYSLVKSIAL